MRVYALITANVSGLKIEGIFSSFELAVLATNTGYYRNMGWCIDCYELDLEEPPITIWNNYAQSGYELSVKKYEIFAELRKQK